MKIGEDKTEREGMKWVKTTHSGRNLYVAAMGFRGSFAATRVLQGHKTWSEVAAKNWLSDQ